MKSSSTSIPMAMRLDTLSPPEEVTLRYFQHGKILLGYTEGAGEERSLQRILEHSGLIPLHTTLFRLTQKHTNRIYTAAPDISGAEGDGILLESGGILAIIRTADCTPLFFWEESSGMAGLLHVGWRGLAQGILNNFRQILKTLRISIQDVHIFLGPAIGGDCYEVGEELLSHFQINEPARSGFSRGDGNRLTLDIRKSIFRSLAAFGIPENQVESSPHCTHCEPGFPSYRRDGSHCGRMLSFIIRRN